MAQGKVFAGHQHSRSAIGQRRRGARGDHAIGAKCGLERSQGFQRGLWADAAIRVDNLPIGCVDGHDLVAQPASVACHCRFLMGLLRQLFLLSPIDAVALRHVLGRVTHGDVGLWVARQKLGAGVKGQAALGHHGHGFDASADEGLAHARLDLRCGHVDG